MFFFSSFQSLSVLSSNISHDLSSRLLENKCLATTAALVPRALSVRDVSLSSDGDTRHYKAEMKPSVKTRSPVEQSFPGPELQGCLELWPLSAHLNLPLDLRHQEYATTSVNFAFRPQVFWINDDVCGQDNNSYE